MKRLLSILIVAVSLFAFAACAGSAEEDGQNPVMNYIGPYACDRATMNIEATDSKNGAKATLTWASSATESSEWVMEGTFDDETRTITYDKATRTDYVYDENGDVKSEKEVYSDGTGKIVFKEGKGITLTWQDDKEDAGKDMTFTFAQ